jgi:hypothetical protein
MREMTATLPDGRVVKARQEGPTGDWIIFLEGAKHRAVQGRWLLRTISDLLDLPAGNKPAWVHDIVSQFSGWDTPAGRRYPCPCCDFLTLPKPPTGTHEICPVCRWEDDAVQYEELDRKGGANKMSLRQARENFVRYGVKDLSAADRVRAPEPYERP